MITVLRHYFKNRAHIILWVIIGAFVIGFLPLAFNQITQSTTWAIKVNGQEIGSHEFLLEKERQKENIMAFRAQYGEYADWLLSLMGARDPQILAVRALGKQELMNQFADTLGIYISDAFVAKKMNDPLFVQKELNAIIPSQLVDPKMGIDEKILEQYVKRLGFSIDLFERQVERIIIEKLVTDLVTSMLYLPEFDIRQNFLAQQAKKSFSLFSYPLTSFYEEEKKKPVTSESLAVFYDEQNKIKNRYIVPEKRTATIWTFDPQSYQIAITDAQINQYYQENKIKKYIETPTAVTVRHIFFALDDPSKRVAIQEKAGRIKEELIKDPAQFEALAKNFSDDAQTASDGGLLEPFIRGSHEPSFDRAAFILQKDGDVSDVIETGRGLEIIQRVGKTPQKFKPLESVETEIRQTLHSKMFQKQFVADLQKVINHSQMLTALIEQKGGSARQIERSADNTSIAQHLFKVQKSGDHAFFIDDQLGIVLRLDSTQKKYTPALDTIKSTVLADYYEDNAKIALKNTIENKKKNGANQALDELKKTIDGEYVHIGWITPGDKDHIEKLKSDGFPIDQMLQMEKTGSLVAVTNDQGGFIGRLDEIEPINIDTFKDKRDEVAQALKQERMTQYLEGFVASLYRNATIETNESVITLQYN